MGETRIGIENRQLPDGTWAFDKGMHVDVGTPHAPFSALRRALIVDAGEDFVVLEVPSESERTIQP